MGVVIQNHLCGILICGSNTSSLSPTSIPSVGVGFNAFLYFFLKSSTSSMFSLSFPSGIEESTLPGAIFDWTHGRK